MAFGLPTLIRRVRQRRTNRAALGTVDPRGPVFISYRVSDGSALAADTAWALRAGGVPVWHDQSDLPPGDTNRRLADALKSGLSGAVLLVTPEIECSRVVREIELPLLLALEKNEAFTLSVLSAIEGECGKLDYGAPDRLLGQREGTIRRLNQHATRTAPQRAEAARAQCQRRMQAIRTDIEELGGTLTIDMQTRIAPSASRVDADLVLRLPPPLVGQRRPHHGGLNDLGLFLAGLPDLMARAGAKQIRVQGGAHLSVAYALGAALPTTLIGRVEAIDTAQCSWATTGQPPTRDASNPLLSVEAVSPSNAGTSPILVYLDLLATRSDSAFSDLISETPVRFSVAIHVRPSRDGNLRSEEAAAITGEAAQIIRHLAGQYQNPDLHLLLRCPWPLALLLGRTLNTLRVHLYEWEDGPDDDGNTVRPRYLPSLVVRSGAGGSPIERVVC